MVSKLSLHRDNQYIFYAYIKVNTFRDRIPFYISFLLFLSEYDYFLYPTFTLYSKCCRYSQGRLGGKPCERKFIFRPKDIRNNVYSMFHLNSGTKYISAKWNLIEIKLFFFN